jgi:hypothetical protein
MATIRQVTEHNGENNWLGEFRNNVTSQCGEDGMIDKIFSILPDSDKWCVEFGAWDGKQFSNTYNLIANNGWSGVLIEAQLQKFEELLDTYSGNDKAICLNEFVEINGTSSLDNILAATNIPQKFDLLSIDIDSCIML